MQSIKLRSIAKLLYTFKNQTSDYTYITGANRVLATVEPLLTLINFFDIKPLQLHTHLQTCLSWKQLVTYTLA